jgi:hypothetical protein
MVADKNCTITAADLVTAEDHPSYSTHSYIGARIPVQPDDAPPPPAPEHGETIKAIPAPPYNDDRHRLMGKKIPENLQERGLLDASTRDRMTAEQMYAGIRESISASTAECYRADAVEPSAKDISRAHTYRLWKGTRLPPRYVPDIIQLREENKLYRALTKQFRDSGAATRTSSLTAQASAVNPAVGAKLAEIRRNRKRTRKVFELFKAQKTMRYRQLLDHYRSTGDIHTWVLMVKQVSAMTPGLDTNVTDRIRDAPGHPSAMQRFLAYFQEHFGQSRPPPSIISSAEVAAQFFPHVPQVQPELCEGLTTDFTGAEFEVVTFPADKNSPPPDECAGGGPTCPLCKRDKAEWAAWDGDTDGAAGHVPSFKPHIHTSVSGGPDGSRPENVVWSRCDDHAETRKYRKQFCDTLAALTNKIMAEGRMPGEAVMNRTVVLLKPAKLGAQEPDDTDPQNYRPITMADVIPKLIGLAIGRRLSHWAVTNNVISEEQCGFMPGRATEDCVFSLLGTVKCRWEEGKPTYVAFIDLKAAYDTVHPEALWRCLRHMGIPDSIVKVLADWSSRRMTQLEVNGERSAPFPMGMGIAQGDVLSPLLFNLLSESLTRYLKSVADKRETYLGIRIGGTLITELRYADDSALLAESPEELGHAVQAFNQWCNAWGFTINTSKGKSEAMAFFPPGSPERTTSPKLNPLPLAPDSDPDTGTIKWVDEYRYLGLLVNRTLDLRVNHKVVLDRVRKNWFKYFVSTSLARKCPPRAALQLYQMLVHSAFNYLAAFIPPDEAFCKEMDTFTVTVVRNALRAKSLPTAAAIGESGLLAGNPCLYRDRYRLYWKLKLAHTQDHLSNVVSAKLFRHMEQQAAMLGPAVLPWRKEDQLAYLDKLSWPRVCLAYNRQAHSSLPWPDWGPLEPVSITDITAKAAICARAVAAVQWHQQVSATLKSSKGHPTTIEQVTTAAATQHLLPCRSPTVAVTALYSPLPLLAHAQLVLDSHRAATSLSTPGPAGGAGLLRLDPQERPSMYRWALVTIRLGTSGLFSRLFFTKEELAEALKVVENKYREIPCRRCNQQSQCPLHVYLTCPHAASTEARQASFTSNALCGIFKEVGKLLPHAEMYRKAPKSKPGQPEPPEVKELRSRRDALTAGMGYFTASLNAASPSPAHCFMLSRLLAVCPWSKATAAAARSAARAQQQQEEAGTAEAHPEVWVFAELLGQCFDDIAVKPHLLCHLVKAWIDWAAPTCFKIAVAWKYDRVRAHEGTGYDSDPDSAARASRPARGRSRSRSAVRQPSAFEQDLADLPPTRRRSQSQRLREAHESAALQGIELGALFPLSRNHSGSESSFDLEFEDEGSNEDEEEDEEEQ